MRAGSHQPVSTVRSGAVPLDSIVRNSFILLSMVLAVAGLGAFIGLGSGLQWSMGMWVGLMVVFIGGLALGAWLVHYSTDYVFDGSGTRPWVETYTPAPLSVYGRTNLEGEQLIQQSGDKHLILRTSWVYAARGGTRKAA